jgi:flagellar biosynthesis protein FlhF
MIVRRFHAASTREALREVRDALGADALILSNRRLPSGGIELVAMTESGSESDILPAPFAARDGVDSTRRSAIDAYAQAAGPQSQGDMASDDFALDVPVWSAAAIAARQSAARAAAGNPAPLPTAADAGAAAQARAPVSPAPELPAAAPAAVRSATSGQRAAQERVITGRSNAAPESGAITEIAAEVRSLRSLVEQQLAGFAWGERARRSPVETEVMRRLLAAGFSTLLARELAESVVPGVAEAAAGAASAGSPDGRSEAAATMVDNAWRQVRAALLERLKGLVRPTDPCEQGGVFALVGPTGVGKTTTVAKLAARCVLTRGAASTALLTTDGFRIGAIDQLRIYGRILGVPVIAVRDDPELQLTLGDLSARHLTLIDTVGMSQRDRRLAEQVALLSGEGRQVARVLLLCAAASGSALEDVATRYGGGLDGCILTKIDEAVSLGGVLDVVLRHRLRVHFVTNGQRVPEDLHLPNPLYLIDRALRGREAANPFTPASDDYALIAASGGSGV